MASRALMARLRTATSSWVGSAITGIIASSRSNCFLDPRAEHVAQQRAHVLDQRRDVGRPDLEPLDPAEREQLAGQPRAALGRRQRVLGIALELGVVGALGDDVEAADDHRQQIVEVVRDAAGELAQRLHLLALPQLLLRGLEFGDVARLEQQIDDLAVGPRGPAATETSRYAVGTPSRSICTSEVNDLARRRRRDRLLHQRDVLRIGAKVGASHILRPTAARRVVVAPRLAPLFNSTIVPSGSSRTITSSTVSNTARNRASLRASSRGLLLDLAAKLELGLLGESDVARRPR